MALEYEEDPEWTVPAPFQRAGSRGEEQIYDMIITAVGIRTSFFYKANPKKKWYCRDTVDQSIPYDSRKDCRVPDAEEGYIVVETTGTKWPPEEMRFGFFGHNHGPIVI
ncbi:unnamed protein product [Cylicostephanus goldi]|uniref:Uncharacterized protein n=1 Tax=Cylicostephanus goldi TaxID=71465 RepID=A0A3P7MAE4_CYLGO|nr:unnamed protein product [Cylicostephanus goldi]